MVENPKTIMNNIKNRLHAQLLQGNLTDDTLCQYGQFIANMEMFKLLDIVNLDAMQIITEIKDLDLMKREVAIQTEMFADEFQKGVRNMFKKFD